MDVLNRHVAQRRSPKHVLVDNGSEFTGRLMDLWAYHHGTRIDFSRPGKPTDNIFIETFNGSLRDECLNIQWFDQLEQDKWILEAWCRDYNESRPRSYLNDLNRSNMSARSITWSKFKASQPSKTNRRNRSKSPSGSRGPFSQASIGSKFPGQVKVTRSCFFDQLFSRKAERTLLSFDPMKTWHLSVDGIAKWR